MMDGTVEGKVHSHEYTYCDENKQVLGKKEATRGRVTSGVNNCGGQYKQLNQLVF